MSELVGKQRGTRNFRWQLLASVSTATLLTLASVAWSAEADEADRPTVWIELGGQLEGIDNSQKSFSPSFMASITQANLLQTLNVEKPAAYAIGGEGKISFQPLESDWVFSAAVRFGRSNATRARHQQTANAEIPVNVPIPTLGVGKYATYYPNQHVRLADAVEQENESHDVLDFQAGKDVGLGIFGARGSSLLSVGIRIAQFTSRTSIKLHAEPDVQYPTKPITTIPDWRAFKYTPIHFHDFAAMLSNQRSFHGAGPSGDWSGSLPLLGDADRGEITLDWGANVAALFGRQKTKGHHQTTEKAYYFNKWQNRTIGRPLVGKPLIDGHFFNKTKAYNYANPSAFDTYPPHPTAHNADGASFNRARTVIVPNAGGTAGISFRYTNAKVSFGYRADFFFGAMDGGIDIPKSEDVGFHGPFATISIGLP